MNKFSYTSTFSDYWRFNRYALGKSMRILLWIACSLIVVFAVSPWALHRMGHEGGVWAAYRQNWGVLILPSFIALMFGFSYFGARTRWNKAEELRVEKTYEIGEEGIQVRGDGVNGFLAWQHFACAEYRNGWFYLKTRQNSFHYFPSAAVPDVIALNEVLKRSVEKTEGIEAAQPGATDNLDGA